MNYKEKLDMLYATEKEGECPPESKEEFVGDQIFDFTTYDGSMTKLFATQMLEVCWHIHNRTAFEYQEDKNNYLTYLSMVNMDFLSDKLEWGTSIRGAWFDEHGHSSDKEKTYSIGITDIVIPKSEIKDFISELIEWVKKDGV